MSRRAGAAPTYDTAIAAAYSVKGLCQMCGKAHEGGYASGRFCTRTCAARYSTQGDPDSFTPFRPYLAHFFPENSRFLRVFTASPRRFQRAQNRNPGPRNSVKGAQTPFRRPS